MKFDFIVLGATGMQGRIVSKDLLVSGHHVLMCGRDRTRVKHLLNNYEKTAFEYVDVRDTVRTSKIIKKSNAKVVENCVEGNWNLKALDACIKSGAHSIDLGSDIEMTKEQLGRDSLLKKKKLVHVTGCGSVPGIGNVMLRYAEKKFDKIDGVEVGFAWDSNIKKFVVPFSIQSIIEEFTASAPIVENRKIVNVKPIDSIVNCHHRGIGREKQFNVGHHPETYTFYRYCKKKGIKDVKFYAGFPDHSYKGIMGMIELGFGSYEEINFNNKKIKPIEFLTEVLKNIEMPDGYTETENLWVEIKNKNKETKMECIASTLKGWEDAGCNIDTGMPASIIAQMIKKEVINKPGSYAPEEIVPPEEFFAELKKRKMIIYENGRMIN